MQIHELEALGRVPATGDKLVIDTGDVTAKIDYDALATAIISKLGGDPVTIAHGGTGATSAAAARNALGLGNTAGALPVANGGTGATSAAGARSGIGIRYAIYNSVTNIGLTSGSATILAAFNALGNNAILYATGNDFAASALPNNSQAGCVEIVRNSDGRAHVMFYGKGGSLGDYRMALSASSYNGNDPNLPNGVWFPDPTTCRGGTGSSGTTLQITVPSNSSHLLILSGNGTERYWCGLIMANSQGATTAIEIKKGTGATIATATNKVTLTCSSGTELAFICYPIRGNRFSAFTIS